MFEHPFEKEIASKIIYQFHKKRLLCETDKQCAHKIGVTFKKLMELLNIGIQYFVTSQKVEIITLSSFPKLEVPENGMDTTSVITEDSNKHQLLVIKFLQAISILKELESKNYIIILNENNYKNLDKPENYEVIELLDPPIVEFISRLVGSRIIPTTTLIELSIHDFIVESTRQYNHQVKLSEQAIAQAKEANDIAVLSLKIAKYSIWIAVAVAILTCLASSLIAIFTPITIGEESIQNLATEIVNALPASIR